MAFMLAFMDYTYSKFLEVPAGCTRQTVIILRLRFSFNVHSPHLINVCIIVIVIIIIIKTKNSTSTHSKKTLDKQ